MAEVVKLTPQQAFIQWVTKNPLPCHSFITGRVDGVERGTDSETGEVFFEHKITIPARDNMSFPQKLIARAPAKVANAGEIINGVISSNSYIRRKKGSNDKDGNPTFWEFPNTNFNLVELF